MDREPESCKCGKSLCADARGHLVWKVNRKISIRCGTVNHNFYCFTEPSSNSEQEAPSWITISLQATGASYDARTRLLLLFLLILSFEIPPDESGQKCTDDRVRQRN